MAADARGRLIAGAVSMMRENGVAGMGLSELTRRSGTARRSIYLNFPGGKSELVAEATRVIGASLTGVLESLTAEPNPVFAFARMWESVLLESDFAAGCPITAATLGRHQAPEGVLAAAEVFAQWTGRVRDWLHEQGVDHSLSEGLATSLIAAIEGAVLLSQAQRSVAPLEYVAESMQSLIHSFTTPTVASNGS
ncbi:TetR/AcrR family transcriptional regulator [Nocardia brasiliensis]|uniref:Transcriptional regulatory protein n=1 Tax=Nocardia brasiliensis (strain ATCC 700358 / HUJEG-1) TaxID=1133849 RepID=K0ET08_NOCB7|nr:TetR family transcriptional regulator [Nocardia brasiliensis]AFU02933.1 transcriptional regulatory protein [Nocardia brasiliensis ATCC 700358]OCF86007.1 TetR family transcriptional regulator [Nocardia brasiliensis]